jgi:hypothetical protein
MKKSQKPNTSFLTDVKRLGDKIQFLQTTDLHLWLISLFFGALSSITLGATFVSIGAGHTFIKIIGNEHTSNRIAFILGFLSMFAVQYTIQTLVQAAGEQLDTKTNHQQYILFGLVKLEKFNMPQLFAIALSILAVVISFYGVYHLQDLVQNDKLMTFLVLFSVVGEIAMIFVVNVRMYLKKIRINNNWIVQQIEKEDKEAFELATSQNKVAPNLLGTNQVEDFDSLLSAIRKPNQASTKIELPDLSKFITT